MVSSPFYIPFSDPWEKYAEVRIEKWHLFHCSSNGQAAYRDLVAMWKPKCKIYAHYERTRKVSAIIESVRDSVTEQIAVNNS